MRTLSHQGCPLLMRPNESGRKATRVGLDSGPPHPRQRSGQARFTRDPFGPMRLATSRFLRAPVAPVQQRKRLHPPLPN
jgi:hypothetical protein